MQINNVDSGESERGEGSSATHARGVRGEPRARSAERRATSDERTTSEEQARDLHQRGEKRQASVPAKVSP